MIDIHQLAVYGIAYFAAAAALTVGWVWIHGACGPAAARAGGEGDAPTPPMREKAPDAARRAARRRRFAALVVLAVAAAARVALVAADPPMLSDDLARYVDDGSTLAQGENPYAASPHEKYFPDAVPPGGPVNHPKLVTIYQPMSQWVFAGLWEVHAAAVSIVGRFPPRVTFRLGFVAADLLVIALLLGELRRAGRSAWWAALYAWHPLAITETAISAHQEPIGIALLLGACALATRRRAALSAAAMAGAIAVKPVVAPLALVLLWRGRGVGRRAMGGAVLAGGAALAALYLPFAMMHGGIGRMLRTVHVFVTTWAINGSVYPWAVSVIGGREIVDAAVAGALGIVLAVGARRGRSAAGPWAAVGGYLLAALLLSSAVFPWYVLWPLAVVPLLASQGPSRGPSRGPKQRAGEGGRAIAAVVWVFAAAVPLSYTANVNPPTGRPWAWAWALEYALVYGAVVAAAAWWGWTRWRHRQRSGAAHPAAGRR